MSRAQLTSTVEQNTGGAVAPFVAGKNFVINGGMDIWQRGTSFTTVTTYTADRWLAYFSTGGCTITQDSTTVPTGLRYSLKATTSGATGAVEFIQAIETANTIPLAGQTVTLSWYSTCSTSVNTSISLGYSTTVDNSVVGTYTTITPAAYFTPTMTGTMQRSWATYAIPSTAKTLQIAIAPNSSLVAGSTFNLTGVQLEAGSVATPFTTATGTVQGELAACQRYYQKSYLSTQYAGQASTGNTCLAYSATTVSSNANQTTYFFNNAMRTTPTITIYSPSTGTAARVYEGPAATDRTAVVERQSNSQGGLYVSAVVASVGNWLSYHYVAEAEL